MRPDLLLLRVMGRALILWDAVQPTTEWVLEQVPLMVKEAWNGLGRARDDDEEEEEPDAGRVVGGEASIGEAVTFSDADLAAILRGDDDLARILTGTASDGGDSGGGGGGSKPPTPCRARPRSAYKHSEHAAAGSSVDVHSVRAAHAHCLAGAVLGLGLRFAGSADADALATALFFARHFQALRDGKPNPKVAIGAHGCGPLPAAAGGLAGLAGMAGMAGLFGQSAAAAALSAQKPDRVALEMCLGCAALAIGCIMAGTGHLESLKTIRALRSRPADAEVSHGNHMAVHLSLGLLFLGGGELTLGTDRPEQLAALVASLFPRFPGSTTDNQCVEQPLNSCFTRLRLVFASNKHVVYFT